MEETDGARPRRRTRQEWFETRAWKEFENMVLRLVIILYVTGAHIAGWILWPSGIKVEYINAHAWPWKRIWQGLCRGFDSQYD